MEALPEEILLKMGATFCSRLTVNVRPTRVRQFTTAKRKTRESPYSHVKKIMITQSRPILGIVNEYNGDRSVFILGPGDNWTHKGL